MLRLSLIYALTSISLYRLRLNIVALYGLRTKVDCNKTFHRETVKYNPNPKCKHDNGIYIFNIQ